MAPLFFAAGFLMVLGQCLCTASLIMGTSRLACASTDHCNPGQWCRVGERNRCNYCGDYAGLAGFINETTTADRCSDEGAEAWIAEFDAIRRQNPEEFFDQNADKLPELGPLLEEWCNTCVHAVNGHVNNMTQGQATALSIAAMGAPDIMVFILTSYIVALTIVGELRDIHLVTLRFARAETAVSMPWQILFGILNAMRRYMFAPGLVVVIGMLVAYEGGDALSLCECAFLVRE